MPEGDILLRTARRLTLALADGPLTTVDLRWPTLADVDLRGRSSLGTASYGKHLLTRFDDGSTLHTHLRMEGSWRISRTTGGAGVSDATGPADPEVPRGSPWAPRGASSAALHSPGGGVRAVLATSVWTCRGHWLGMMDLVRTRDEHLLISHLGPDLLADDAEEHLPAAGRAIAAATGRTIGDVLLDQRFAAGIGTIWMAETLFRHRISPWRAATEVDGAALLLTARRLMQASADAAAAPGSEGSVPRAAHGQLGRACPRRCGDRIAVAQVGTAPQERPAFYCPTCQAN